MQLYTLRILDIFEFPAWRTNKTCLNAFAYLSVFNAFDAQKVNKEVKSIHQKISEEWTLQYEKKQIKGVFF